MHTARKAAATVQAGNFIYNCGGTNKTGYIKSCEFGTFNSEGLPVAWKNTSALNVNRGYTDAVVYQNTLYIVGGANGDHGENLLNTIERASLQADGSLSPWITEKNTLLTPRRGLSVISANGYLYAIGGYNGLFLDTIERAKFLDDGSLGAWQEISTMLQGRYIHSAIKVDNFLYVMGGHKRALGSTLQSVEYTAINPDGSLGEWMETSSLNTPRYNGDVIVMDNHLYFIGGYNQGAIDKVERAKIKTDGSLSLWQILAPLSSPRSALSVIARSPYIIAIGGADQFGLTLASIEQTRLDDQGGIKPWNK